MRFHGPRPRAAVFICALLFLACAGESPGDSAADIVQKDDLGREVRLPPRIERVVTLAPNLTEIVFAAGAGQALIGTDDFSDHPPEAKSLPKVGGMQPNVEKITALQPDVVLASTEGNQPSLAPALAAVNIPLFVVRTDRLDQIPDSISSVGSLLGSSFGETAASTLRDQIRRQRRRRHVAPRVLFAVWADPLYVGGVETFVDDLITLCGARNAVVVKGWPQYSQESLIATPPDILLYPADSVSRQSVERLFAAQPGLLQKVQLVAVDENVFTRPGPRVVDAAARLNEIIDAWQMR